jgi:hypothetical protein
MLNRWQSWHLELCLGPPTFLFIGFGFGFGCRLLFQLILGRSRSSSLSLDVSVLNNAMFSENRGKRLATSGD